MKRSSATLCETLSKVSRYTARLALAKAEFSTYPSGMTVTEASLRHRQRIARHREQIDHLLQHYGARNPMLFGSVVRGDAGPNSDIDILVTLEEGHGSALMRISGLMEEFRETLGVPVDVVAEPLLKRGVSEQALRKAVPL